MKIFSLSLVVALCVAWMASCGKGGNQKEAAQSDSALTAEMVSEVAGPTAYYLTSDSLGPVRIGEEISSLPQAVPNLYDNVLLTETPDAVAYSFMLSDIPQFTIYDFMDGKVDLIALEGNSLGVQTPDSVLRVGDPFVELLKLPGVVAEWESLDDAGIWYWRYQNLFFGIEETHITEQLADALCDGHNPPKAALITPDVKIGYIATGLPF